MFQHTISCIFIYDESVAKIYKIPPPPRRESHFLLFASTYCICANFGCKCLSRWHFYYSFMSSIWQSSLGEYFSVLCCCAAIHVTTTKEDEIVQCFMTYLIWKQTSLFLNKLHAGFVLIKNYMLFMKGLLSTILKIKIKFIGSPKMFDLPTLSSAVRCIVCTTG